MDYLGPNIKYVHFNLHEHFHYYGQKSSLHII
jgi:hypothetical protein